MTNKMLSLRTYLLGLAAGTLAGWLSTACDRGVLTMTDNPGRAAAGTAGAGVNPPGPGEGGKGGSGASAGNGGSGVVVIDGPGGSGGLVTGGPAGSGGSGGSAMVTCQLVNGGGDVGIDAGAGGASAGAGGSAGQGAPQRMCPCSRRPGEHNSFMCPLGEGVTRSVSVGPAGGTLVLSGTQSTRGVAFKLQIPPNALDHPVIIQVTEVASPAPPTPYVDESPVYDIQPAGLLFKVPALLTLPYENVSGIVAPELVIEASRDCGASYKPISDSYINAGFLQGSLSQLGPVFAGYPRTQLDVAACGGDAGAP